MMFRRFRLVFVLLWPLAAMAQSLAQSLVQAPDLNNVATLELQDQFGHSDSLARHRGTPVIVVVVSVRRLAMIERWERDLRERLPAIRFLNIADLPVDAPVDLERTAATLRKRVPPGVAVLMDPARDWATTFALDTTVPNLLVFDASGQLNARFRGRWTGELAGQVADAVSQPDANP